MRQRKKMLGLVMVLGLLAVGCSSAPPPKKEAPAANQAVAIGLMRIDDSIPFYLAEEEGLFAKHGVEVELVPFSSGRDLTVALEAGQLDGAMTDMVVQGLMKKGGIDLKTVAIALGATPEEGRFMVVSAPNSGISKPEDLNGQSVAIANNTMMAYLFAQYETITGIDDATVSKVSIPDLMLRVETLLAGKDIQAAILPDPLASYALEEGANLVIDDTKLGVNVSQSVVAMTEEAIVGKKEELTQVMAAYNEAIDLINADPEAYREFCLTTANVPLSLAETYPTPSFTNQVVPDENQVAQIMDWMVETGLLETAYTYEEMVTKDFIN